MRTRRLEISRVRIPCAGSMAQYGWLGSVMMRDKLFAVVFKISGRSAAWLARLVRDQEAGGSNPLAPTIFPYQKREILHFSVPRAYFHASAVKPSFFAPTPRLKAVSEAYPNLAFFYAPSRKFLRG